jgi:hypothetical protein
MGLRGVRSDDVICGIRMGSDTNGILFVMAFSISLQLLLLPRTQGEVPQILSASPVYLGVVPCQACVLSKRQPPFDSAPETPLRSYFHLRPP